MSTTPHKMKLNKQLNEREEVLVKLGFKLQTENQNLRIRAEKAEAELVNKYKSLQSSVISACNGALITSLYWYPKGYSIDPNDLNKIYQDQVKACVNAIDAAIKEVSK